MRLVPALTASHLGILAGVSRQYPGRILRGGVAEPGSVITSAIAAVYGASPAFLMGFDAPPPSREVAWAAVAAAEGRHAAGSMAEKSHAPVVVQTSTTHKAERIMPREKSYAVTLGTNSSAGRRKTVSVKTVTW